MLRYIALLICGLLLSTLVGGCSTDPATRAHQAKLTYKAGLLAVEKLADAGKISPAAARAILEADDDAQAAIAVLDSAAAGSDVWQAALEQLEQTIARLAEKQSAP